MDPRRQRWLDFQEDEGSDETGPVSHAPIQETRARQQRRRRTRERERTSLSAEERHSRKVEQQRLRRAAQREQTIADSNHISKAERQRQRRAALREQSSPLEIQSVAPTVVLQNRRVAQQERVARARLQDDNILADLSERVLDSIIVTPDEVLWMGKNQRYLQDPRLALVYYYCCGTDPASFVFGDEQLRGEQGESARARIAELLDDFPKSSDIADCQAAVGEVASESTAIWACAACGRIVLANKRENIFFSSLDDLSGVRLSESERETLLLETPEPVARMYRQLYFYGNDIYYLIPDLVRDVNKIPLCKKCRKDPRQNKFSVASGHDYGRIGQLPDLNEVEVSCISPARCFGLELSLSGKHSKGHAICFPTDGPFELSRVLPRVDDRCVPRVTFIGPRETWRIAKKKFSKLYAISGANVYRWLTVLGSMNNIFKEEGIQIEDSPERRILLQELELMIQDGVQISDSAEAGALADMPSTLTGQDVDGDAASENAGVVRDVIMSNLAVLPHVEQSDSAVVHEIIDALAGAVGADLGGKSCVIPIKRARSPLVEWIDNAKIIASVFPHLFLTGSSPLPSGPLPRDFVDHFMHYWDGRFEKSVAFTTMLFNQLQRHAAVQKAARVGLTHGKTMEKFGKLVSTEKFKESLAFAKAHPESREAVKLNAGLLRFLSLVGGNVPFSPFERAATRPKLGAMRYRYGIALHWLTIAPPEHDDLLLHRVAELRKQNAWNVESCPFSKKECRFADFTKELQTDARARLGVASVYPALSAQVFERKLDSLTGDIIRCRDAGATRSSINYLAIKRGVYGRCSAFNAVVEPQVDGRLHAHITVYGSAVNPSLLTRVASCPDLVPHARRYIDAVSCTTTTERARSWCDDWRIVQNGKMPRAFDIDVPDAAENYTRYMEAAEKRVISTNLHSHSLTCRKGTRGRYMCRLSRPAGVHDNITGPLCVRVEAVSVLGKRKRAEFSVHSLSGALADSIDGKLTYVDKRIVREHTNGAIVWEQYRPPKDGMFVETNLSLACLSGAHTNSAIMNGEDAGDMVEEYQQAYMTKEKGGLKYAAVAMHTAAGDILKFPSVADDSGTDLRTAKHLAARTVNAFSGGTEWSHSLMAYALAGHRSYLSSDSFWYVFPNKLVDYVINEALAGAGPDDDEQIGAEVEEKVVHETLDDLIVFANEEETSSAGGAMNTGARMYRISNGEMVLVTQVVSYRCRGKWFEAYSPLEFEMIVDILPRTDDSERDLSRRGRPKRRGFDLSPEHPLAPHFQGFIRAKFKTPMLGGAPPPAVLQNGQPSAALSKYLLCLLTSWGCPDLPDDLSPTRLIAVCKEWNSIGASFLNRQRYQYLHNILRKRWRSSTNERACSEWRSRNADFWTSVNSSPASLHVVSEGERAGLNAKTSELSALEAEELFYMTVAATAKSRPTLNAVRSLRDDFWSMVPDQLQRSSGGTLSGATRDPVFLNRDVEGLSFSRIARSIHSMRPPPESTEEENIAGTGGTEPHSGVSDQLGTTVQDETDRNACSPDQQKLFDRILQSINETGGLRQTLTILHGGGGTGKSALIRRIVSALKRRRINTVNTCPTGVGASHLHCGRTFHSAFKTNRGALSPNDLELLRLTFTENVWLVVVDEVSMFPASYLITLDTRLRAIYRNNLPFGGRSILLAGDFLQLKVPSGKSLCTVLYTTIRSSSDISARSLFRQFDTYFLTQQHRAANCPIQQEILESCRALPRFRPSGDKWSKDEKQEFKPITQKVVESLTTPLDAATIGRDSGWLDDMTILVTSNFDKAVLTGCTARMFAKRNNVMLFRWRRELKKDISSELRQLLYDEDANPELFAYFVPGAPGQVLDNNNGNVSWGVANGTPCKLHSLAWEDETKNTLVRRLMADARGRKDCIVDLPFPPDFVNVQLVDTNGEPRSGDVWPEENNLDMDYVLSESGQKYKKSIIIPIGINKNPQRKPTIRLGAGVLDNPIEVQYITHAVDLAQVMTVWKAQGATLKRVVLNLEPLLKTAPTWKFEHIYVGLSRVTAVANLRCMPLSGAFRRGRLRDLLPDINTTKWRLDNRQLAESNRLSYS